jgi:hypothetical protein
MLSSLGLGFMKNKWQVIVVFILLTAVAIADSGKTSLRFKWASQEYSMKPLPEVWHPASIPSMEQRVEEFLKFSLQEGTLSIPRFIARYGLPTRYIVTGERGGQDFMIYDLPSGHAVALYVNKPPYDIFSAAVIIDSGGTLLRLIK